MLLYVVRSQMHRLISTGFVVKDAYGRPLALTSIEPIVAHKPLRLLDDGHEVLAYPAVDPCTVLRIKVVVANDGEHKYSSLAGISIFTSWPTDNVHPTPSPCNAPARFWSAEPFRDGRGKISKPKLQYCRASYRRKKKSLNSTRDCVPSRRHFLYSERVAS